MFLFPSPNKNCRGPFLSLKVLVLNFPSNRSNSWVLIFGGFPSGWEGLLCRIIQDEGVFRIRRYFLGYLWVLKFFDLNSWFNFAFEFVGFLKSPVLFGRIHFRFQNGLFFPSLFRTCSSSESEIGLFLDSLNGTGTSLQIHSDTSFIPLQLLHHCQIKILFLFSFSSVLACPLLSMLFSVQLILVLPCLAHPCRDPFQERIPSFQ